MPIPKDVQQKLDRAARAIASRKRARAAAERREREAECRAEAKEKRQRARLEPDVRRVRDWLDADGKRLAASMKRAGVLELVLVGPALPDGTPMRELHSGCWLIRLTRSGRAIADHRAGPSFGEEVAIDAATLAKKVPVGLVRKLAAAISDGSLWRQLAAQLDNTEALADEAADEELFEALEDEVE